MFNKVRNANIELVTLKEEVIGLFKYPNSEHFELVVSVNEKNKTFESFRITQFGAVNQLYGMPFDRGTLHLFPKGKNLNDMLNHPMVWVEFLDKFIL